MPSKPTEKCPYQSIFSPGNYVHLGQWLGEKCCQNAAKKEYKELPLQFWQIDKWAKILKLQLIFASRLRKKYRDDAIFSAINDNRARNVFSLNAAWFIKIIEEYELQTPKQTETIIMEVDPIESQEIRPTAGGNNLASLLDE